METLGAILVIILSGVEAYCLWRIRRYIHARSVIRTEERRAATRPPAYAKVHKKYTIMRNRRNLWETVEKREVRR